MTIKLTLLEAHHSLHGVPETIKDDDKTRSDFRGDNDNDCRILFPLRLYLSLGLWILAGDYQRITI